MSTALPPIPDEPWCIRIRLCRSANRLPGVPADSRNCPALAAIPSASVETSLGISRIVSMIASIAGTDPPGELIHSVMSARWSSADSRNSWPISRVPLVSSRASSRTTMRWRRSPSLTGSASGPVRGSGALMHLIVRRVGALAGPLLLLADLPLAERGSALDDRTMSQDAITPDTKDWTWVLERPCPDCGFVASDVAAADVGSVGSGAHRAVGGCARPPGCGAATGAGPVVAAGVRVPRPRRLPRLRRPGPPRARPGRPRLRQLGPGRVGRARPVRGAGPVGRRRRSWPRTRPGWPRPSRTSATTPGTAPATGPTGRASPC